MKIKFCDDFCDTLYLSFASHTNLTVRHSAVFPRARKQKMGFLCFWKIYVCTYNHTCSPIPNTQYMCTIQHTEHGLAKLSCVRLNVAPHGLKTCPDVVFGLYTHVKKCNGSGHALKHITHTQKRTQTKNLVAAYATSSIDADVTHHATADFAPTKWWQLPLNQKRSRNPPTTALDLVLGVCVSVVLCLSRRLLRLFCLPFIPQTRKHTQTDPVPKCHATQKSRYTTQPLAVILCVAALYTIDTYHTCEVWSVPLQKPPTCVLNSPATFSSQ